MAGRRKRRLSEAERRKRKNATQRAYYARHKKRINAALRHKWATDPDYRARRLAAQRKGKCWLQGRYGISSEDYKRMLAQQRGRCAICQRKSKQTLCVDHDHPRRIVRALLCPPCNRGLGFFRDDPNRLLRAAAYLLAFEAKVDTCAARRKAFASAVVTIEKLVAQLPPCADRTGA
jgi:Recombination endonuclease VII